MWSIMGNSWSTQLKNGPYGVSSTTANSTTTKLTTAKQGLWQMMLPRGWSNDVLILDTQLKSNFSHFVRVPFCNKLFQSTQILKGRFLVSFTTLHTYYVMISCWHQELLVIVSKCVANCTYLRKYRYISSIYSIRMGINGTPFRIV